MKKTALVCGMFAMGLLLPAQAQDLSQVQMSATELAAGVYMLKGAGGNIGLSFGEDGAFIIDDQFAPLADKINAAIAELTAKPVRFVINTHWQLYPFIDLESGGGIHGVIEGVNKGLALSNEETRIIPGHGPLSDRDGLRVYRDMMVTLRDRIQALKESGKSLEEAIAAKPGAQWDEAQGGVFIKPAQLVTFIYNSL